MVDKLLVAIKNVVKDGNFGLGFDFSLYLFDFQDGSGFLVGSWAVY